MLARLVFLLCFAAILINPDATHSQTTQSEISQAPPVSAAIPPKLPVANFIDTNTLSGLILSPDGNRIALQITSKETATIAVIDTVTKQPIRRINTPKAAQLKWYRWAGNDRLLISFSSQTIYFDTEARLSRLYLLDLASGTLTFVGKASMGLDGDEIIHVDPKGDFVLLSMQRTIWEYPSVWRFPLDGRPMKEARQVQSAYQNIWDWFADSKGVIRMGFASSQGAAVQIWYRATEDAPLKRIAKLTEDNVDDKIWDVLRVVSNSDVGYVLKPDDTGKVALRRFNYATRTVGETIFAAPGWDITSVDFDQNDEPVAAYYTDDRTHVVWLDPKMRLIQNRLNRAMPGLDVWVTSRADDDSRMIVWAGREDDPGSYLLYDAKKARLDNIITLWPKLNPVQMATPRPISYLARDNTRISAYLTLPKGRKPTGLPLIILPHGGPFGVRDQLNFSAEVQFLANRGYAVLQPNYRGSGGYGDDFEKLGRGQIGRAMQDDLDDAMDWAVSQGIADKARVCVLGSSYGGYAALWAVIRNPERYRCAISFAGVTDWKRQLSYDSGFFNSKNARKWRAKVRGADEAFDLDLVSPAKQVQRITRPILLTHGDEDSNVPFKQFKLMRDAAIKARVPIETIVFEGEGHGLDQPESETKWFEALDRFLASHNPADQPSP